MAMQHACRKVVNLRLYRSGDRPHPRHAADHGQPFLPSWQAPRPPRAGRRGGRHIAAMLLRGEKKELEKRWAASAVLIMNGE